ncbi:MAG TPA: hypothetical protein PLU35_00910 [Phycisphaerales bacterium]|nr:hypothetical protein [Phycisphaerales bacterium]
MKVISPIFTDMSGKLGNTVAAKARGGIQYFRALVIPSNPQSESQSAARSALASAASYFKEVLSDAQRALWRQVATGTQQAITLFTKSNSYRYRAGFEPVNSPPLSFSTPLTRPDVVVDASDGELHITNLSATDPWNITPGLGQPKKALFVFVTEPQPSSRAANPKNYRLAEIVTREGADPPVTSVDVDLAALGYSLTAGDRMFVRMVAINGVGAVSGEQVFDAIIQA